MKCHFSIKKNVSIPAKAIERIKLPIKAWVNFEAKNELIFLVSLNIY